MAVNRCQRVRCIQDNFQKNLGLNTWNRNLNFKKKKTSPKKYPRIFFFGRISHFILDMCYFHTYEDFRKVFFNFNSFISFGQNSTFCHYRKIKSCDLLRALKLKKTSQIPSGENNTETLRASSEHFL